MLACLGAGSALGQGYVNFSNIHGTDLNVPLYLWDGITKASGPAYMAALYAGPTRTSLACWASTTFRSGGGAGYFLGGTVSISTVPGGGVAYCLVDWWDSTLGGTTTGATEAQAYHYFQATGAGCVWGESNCGHPFAVVTGNPNAAPPTVPGALVGLVWIPEPTPLALVTLGVLVLVRRRG